MPKLKVDGFGEFDVPQGKRLVLALEDEAKVDQLHACGGNARCTTCRVEFVAGEPDQMTQAEKSVLAARGLSGIRLSCQIRCDHDMTVRAISRLAGSGRQDAGSRPATRSRRRPSGPRGDASETFTARRRLWRYRDIATPSTMRSRHLTFIWTVALFCCCARGAAPASAP